MDQAQPNRILAPLLSLPANGQGVPGIGAAPDLIRFYCCRRRGLFEHQGAIRRCPREPDSIGVSGYFSSGVGEKAVFDFS